MHRRKMKSRKDAERPLTGGHNGYYEYVSDEPDFDVDISIIVRGAPTGHQALKRLRQKMAKVIANMLADMTD